MKRIASLLLLVLLMMTGCASEDKIVAEVHVPEAQEPALAEKDVEYVCNIYTAFYNRQDELEAMALSFSAGKAYNDRQCIIYMDKYANPELFEQLGDIYDEQCCGRKLQSGVDVIVLEGDKPAAAFTEASDVDVKIKAAVMPLVVNDSGYEDCFVLYDTDGYAVYSAGEAEELVGIIGDTSRFQGQLEGMDGLVGKISNGNLIYVEYSYNSEDGAHMPTHSDGYPYTDYNLPAEMQPMPEPIRPGQEAPGVETNEDPEIMPEDGLMEVI